MQTTAIKNTTSESFADRVRFSIRQQRTSSRRASVSEARAAANGSTLRSLDPEDFREAVYQCLAKLPPKERAEITRELVERLLGARMNVGSRLFILGIPARSIEELTPADLAMLLRSVHISNPPMMRALSATLNRLISRDQQSLHRQAA